MKKKLKKNKDILDELLTKQEDQKNALKKLIKELNKRKPKSMSN